MDAIYQCFKNREKVEFVLDNFFKNGGNKVYLCSDQGDDGISIPIRVCNDSANCNLHVIIIVILIRIYITV